MSEENRLQQRIGGSAAGMNASALLTAAQRALTRLEPRVVGALFVQRQALRALLAMASIEVEALSAIAHDARGLAGTFGYARLGAVADALCRYIGACREAAQSPAPEVLRLLGQAMDQGFVKDEEGGPLLDELSRGALALARAKAPRAG